MLGVKILNLENPHEQFNEYLTPSYEYWFELGSGSWMNDNMVVAVLCCVDVTRSRTIISHGVNVTGPRVPAQPGTSRVISTRTLHTHSSHTHGDAPSQNRYLAFIAIMCLIFAMFIHDHIVGHSPS